jgi:hypothetical protein
VNGRRAACTGDEGSFCALTVAIGMNGRCRFGPDGLYLFKTPFYLIGNLFRISTNLNSR